MMGDKTPTILLIHGCFSTPSCFDKLIPYLNDAGYPTLTASYPSSNPKDPSTVTCQKDIDHVRDQYLLLLVENEGKDLILALHSFGGVVGGAAALGLSKTVRSASGKQGGIVGLVYIAGNIVQKDQTLVESAGGQWPPWLVKDKPIAGVAIVDPLMETIYNDCDESLRPELEAAMAPQGYHCLTSAASTPCWTEEGFSGRLAYIRTARDNVNPAFAQDLWMESSGVHWVVAKMDASHGPFISQPKQLAEIIVDFAHQFELV